MRRIKKIEIQNPQRKVSASSVVLLLAAFLLLQDFQGYAQKENIPFVPGETALYGAYFNWHFIWMNAGEVLFESDTIQYKNQKAWYLKAVGKTYKAYDVFYSVRDTFESVLSWPDFESLWFRRVVNHGKGHSSHEYHFSPKEGLIRSRIDRENETPFSDRISYSKSLHDLLSSAYYFRGFDFEQMKAGQKVNFKMLVDNKTEELYFRYLGTEKVKTRNNREFLCHKMSVWLLEGDFFPGGEHMKVWVTADRNRLPVMVETKIAVGWVKAILLKEQKLKYPLTSEMRVK